MFINLVVFILVIKVCTLENSLQDESDFEGEQYCLNQTRLITLEKAGEIYVVDVLPFSTVLLECKFCNDNSVRGGRSWYFHSFTTNRYGDIDINRIKETKLRSIILNNLTHADIGLYSCRPIYEDDIYNSFNYLIDLKDKSISNLTEIVGNLNDWSIYQINYLGVANEKIENVTFTVKGTILVIKFEVFSDWSNWKECDGCLQIPIRKRVGHCRVKIFCVIPEGCIHLLKSSHLNITRLGLVKVIVETGTPLPCRGEILAANFTHVWREVNSIPDFVHVEPCSAECQLSAKKGPSYRKLIKLREGEGKTLICPKHLGSTHVRWEYNRRKLQNGHYNPELDKVIVDNFGSLHLYAVAKELEGNYTCFDDDKRIMEVILTITTESRITTPEFWRHFLYVIYVLLACFICYLFVIIGVFIRRSRDKKRRNIDENKFLIKANEMESDDEVELEMADSNDEDLKKSNNAFTKLRKKLKWKKPLEHFASEEEVAIQKNKMFNNTKQKFQFKRKQTDFEENAENNPKEDAQLQLITDINNYKNEKWKQEKVKKKREWNKKFVDVKTKIANLKNYRWNDNEKKEEKVDLHQRPSRLYEQHKNKHQERTRLSKAEELGQNDWEDDGEEQKQFSSIDDDSVKTHKKFDFLKRLKNKVKWKSKYEETEKDIENLQNNETEDTEITQQDTESDDEGEIRSFDNYHSEDDLLEAEREKGNWLRTPKRFAQQLKNKIKLKKKHSNLRNYPLEDDGEEEEKVDLIKYYRTDERPKSRPEVGLTINNLKGKTTNNKFENYKWGYNDEYEERRSPSRRKIVTKLKNKFKRRNKNSGIKAEAENLTNEEWEDDIKQEQLNDSMYLGREREYESYKHYRPSWEEQEEGADKSVKQSGKLKPIRQRKNNLKTKSSNIGYLNNNGWKTIEEPEAEEVTEMPEKYKKSRSRSRSVSTKRHLETGIENENNEIDYWHYNEEEDDEDKMRSAKKSKQRISGSKNVLRKKRLETGMEIENFENDNWLDEESYELQGTRRLVSKNSKTSRSRYPEETIDIYRRSLSGKSVSDNNVERKSKGDKRVKRSKTQDVDSRSSVANATKFKSRPTLELVNTEEEIGVFAGESLNSLEDKFSVETENYYPYGKTKKRSPSFKQRMSRRRWTVAVPSTQSIINEMETVSE